MRDESQNNFQSVGPVRLHAVETLKPEDGKLNVNIVNCFTDDLFSRKLVSTENILKDKRVFMFHL